MTTRERQKLERAAAKIEAREGELAAAQRESAALVRAIGISTVARELGISCQALDSRLKTLERRAR